MVIKLGTMLINGVNGFDQISWIFRGIQNTEIPQSCTKKAQRDQSQYIILLTKRIFCVEKINTFTSVRQKL